MAHHKSAEKRIRQRAKRREQNRLVLGAVRTYVKRVRSAVAEGDREGAMKLLGNAVSRLDQAVTKGALHRKTASRTISRLSRAVQKLS